MKALVLAGGAGTRLRPLTHTRAKQLVPVAGRPILFYALDQIAAAGITDAGIVVSGETGAEVREAVGDGHRFGLTVTYVDQHAPLGIAHALLAGADFLAGDDIALFLGDNLVEGGISALVADFAATRPDARILLKRVDDPSRFGVATLDADGRVTALVEKPVTPATDLALVGVYLFSPAILAAARAIRPSPRGELEITDAIQHLVDTGHDVRASQLDGWWLDTGKKDDLLDANRLLLASLTGRVDGQVDAASTLTDAVVVEPGAVVIGSRIRGPVVVGARTRIVDSEVGPFTAIGPDGVIERSSLSGSVLAERCHLVDVGPLEGSLLGRDVRVGRALGEPGRVTLMLGDHCEVGL